MIKPLEKTTVLKGKSGKKYIFDLYSFDFFQDLTTFNEKKAAMYLFSNRHISGEVYMHNYIYLGETKDISTRFEDHHKKPCIEHYKANCIGFWWASEDDVKRKEAESDLLAVYNFPCNKNE